MADCWRQARIGFRHFFYQSPEQTLRPVLKKDHTSAPKSSAVFGSQNLKGLVLHMRFYVKDNFYFKKDINEYFPVNLPRQTASSKNQMGARANEAAEAQIQGGSNTIPLCDSSVLDLHSNLMKSQEQTGAGMSSQTFTLHDFATHRHVVRLENQHSGHSQLNLKSLLVD